MKQTLLFSALLFAALSGTGQTRPDIIIQYLDQTDMELYLIGNTGNTVVDPTDLEFHPDLSKNELWVVNKGSVASGGHCVIFSETGTISQTSQSKADEFKELYMSRVTGIAFSSNGNFATISGIYDAFHDGGDPFTGPTLWSSDLAVFGEPGMGDGSHIDDLHQTPYGQGIAWETQNAFWVFDGYNGDIVRYDFVNDHGPGGDGESDGIVRRYGSLWELEVHRDTNDVVVSHLAMDPNSNWLYIVDHGTSRVLRLDVTTGEVGGTPFFGPWEPLAEYSEMTNFEWQTVIEDTTIHEMSGIAIVNNKLLIADHETGDIMVYLTDGDNAFDEWFRIETGDPGIQGLEIGPDGRIFYANEFNNKVRRIDTPALNVAEIPAADKMKVYPNPSLGEFIVHFESDFTLEDVTILTQDGKSMEVSGSVLDGQSIRIDASSYMSGVYYVNVSSTTGTSTQRVIIQ